MSNRWNLYRREENLLHLSSWLLFFKSYRKYRSSNTSANIYPCNQFSQACLGGYDSGCDVGYTGIICGTCATNGNSQFFRKGLYYCDTCSQVWIYVIVAFVFLLVLLRFVSVMTSDKNEDNFSYVLIKLIIKLITTHFQTLAYVSNVQINFITLPNFLMNFYAIQMILGTADSFLSLSECALEALRFPSVYVLKLFLSVVFLFFGFFLIVIFWFIWGHSKKHFRDKIIFNIVNTSLIIVNFIQPAYINFYMQNLMCDEYDGVKYLTFNLNQVCWDKIHTLMSLLITIPFLVFFMVIYPLVKSFIFLKRLMFFDRDI